MRSITAEDSKNWLPNRISRRENSILLASPGSQLAVAPEIIYY